MLIMIAEVVVVGSVLNIKSICFTVWFNVKKKLLSVAIAVILWNKLSFFTNKSKLYYIMVLLFKVEQVVASGSFMERYA